LFCQKCGASAAEDSQFCSRCGNAFNAVTTPLVAQSPPHGIRRGLGIIFAVIVMAVGGLLWFASTRESDPRPPREPQDNAAAARMQTAIRLCDSAARAKLYFPNTMELVGEPESWPNDLGGFVVNRDIAARDKQGVRYRYRYFCVAIADGRGGLSGASVDLEPTNN
jgi:hypothetical protein